MGEDTAGGRAWHFLTNHALVYLHLVEHPGDTIRQISDHLVLAERTVAGVIADLKRDGYVSVEKSGRRNTYTVVTEMPMRHQPVAHYTVQEFFALLSPERTQGEGE